MLDTFFAYNPPTTKLSHGGSSSKNIVDYKKNPTKLFKRIEGKAWELALERIQTNNVETKIWVSKTGYDGAVTWKRLPLHEACIHKPTPKVIQALINTYPKAASKSDLDGRLPLHHACANGASLETLEQLLIAYPDGISMVDSWKKTPLQTLMGQYFPDPHCISALKRGAEYYIVQRQSHNISQSVPSSPVPPARSMANTEQHHHQQQQQQQRQLPPALNHGQYGQNNHRAPSPQPRQVRGNVSPIRRQQSSTDNHMITGLEGEIGRFSQQIAVNMDEKNEMQRKIRQLESELNRLLGYETDNARLQTDVRELEDELQASKDAFERERVESQRDLKILSDVQRSEERLKRELEEMENDPRSRMLEVKVESLKQELLEKENRANRDIHNLKMALDNVDRNAEMSKAAANKYEDECNRLEMEMKRIAYEKDNAKEIIHNLKDKVVEADNVKREFGELDRRYRDEEERSRRLTQKLQLIEEDNLMLREEASHIPRLREDLHNQVNYIKDMEMKLDMSEEKFMKLSDTLNAKDRMDRGMEDTHVAEKNEMKKTIAELKSDLEKAQTKNSNSRQDKADVEKRLQKAEISLKQTRTERDEIKRRELSISLEVNKLQRSIDGKLSEYKTKVSQEQAVSKTHVDRCKELEKEVTKLRNDINDTKTSDNQTMREIFTLERVVKDQENAIERYKEDIVRLETDRADIKKSLKIQEQNWKDEDSKLSEMRDQANKAMHENEEAQKKIKDETIKFQQQISELEKELDSRKESEIRAAGDNQLFQTDYKKLELTASDLKLKIKRLEDERGQTEINRDTMMETRQKYMSAMEENDTLRSELKQMEFIADSLKREMQMLESEKAQTGNNLDLVSEERRKYILAKEENETLRFDVKKLESNIVKLNLEIQRLAKAKGENNERVSEEKQDLEKRINKLMRSEAKSSGEILGSKINRDLNRGDMEYNFVGQEIQVWKSRSKETASNASDEDEDDLSLNDQKEKLSDLQKENEMLRALLEEDDSKSANSLEELEERLYTLEQMKNAEISILVEERSELLSDISTLKDRIQMLEGENKRLKEEHNFRASEIDKLKQKRDRKKKTIEDRLRAYESASCAGSVVDARKIRARIDKDETMSTISAITSHSTGPSADSGRSRHHSRVSKINDLTAIFPSSVSVSDLSIGNRSTISTGKQKLRSRLSYGSSSKYIPRQSILEERDEGALSRDS